MTKAAKVTLPIIIGALAISSLLFYFACRDQHDYFRRTKGTLNSVQVREYRSDRFFSRHAVSLSSSSSLKVDVSLLVPRDQKPLQRYPVVVVLAGLETGKHAVDYIGGIPDVIIAAIDYPYTLQSLNTPSIVATEMLPLRRAALETVSSVMLAIDYLAWRPDVDMRKVVIVGLSLGAVFVPAITVEDRRLAEAVMVFGGGNLREIIRRNLGHSIGPVASDLTSYTGAILLRPIEPMRYVDRISPIPLLMINGTRDEEIPRESIDRLFSKAKDPKKLIWLQSGHIRPDDRELTKLIVEILLKELSPLFSS